MAKTRRTRMSAENDHRRVTRPRLRIIVKETQGYPTGYLRAPSDTIEYDHESREVKAGREQDEAVFGSYNCSARTLLRPAASSPVPPPLTYPPPLQQIKAVSII